MNSRGITLYCILMLSQVSCDADKQESKPTATPVVPAPSLPANTSISNTSASAVASYPSPPVNTSTSNLPASAVAPAPTVKDGVPSNVAVTPPHQTSTETFVAGEIVYVTATNASVDLNGTLVTLPIGTSAEVKGDAESCSFESDFNEDAICIFIGDIYGGAIDPGFPDGLASSNGFGHRPPNLADLLVEYDETPKKNKDIRKELAEKATALDPWSSEAHKRVIEVLSETDDRKAIDAAEDTYRRYQVHQPQIIKGELQTVFHYDGKQIIPFVANTNGVLTSTGPSAAINRGSFFNVYGEHKGGLAVTTQTFSCEPKCPLFIPIKNIGLDGKPTNSKLEGIYATNFTWPERSRPLPAITREQKAILTNMLKESVANYSTEVATAAQTALKSGKVAVMSGQLSADGRIFLVGGLEIGSASDEHYNDMPYFSDFVILEQQKNGSLSKAALNVPYFKAEYCNISGILRDVDGDGTDEIITYCNSSVEGPYADNLNGILQRVNNKWVKAF
jgi:hypothetical protein